MMRVLASTLILLLVCLAPMTAQTSGEITGEIRDPSGSVVVGARVSVINKANAAVRTVLTNDAGVYSFPSLQPGIYEIKVAMQGFQSMTRSDLELQVQQTARVDFTLQLGQVSEVVEVTGATGLLTTENATVGTVIENKRIVEL